MQTFQLRPYQENAIRSTFAALGEHQSALFVLATGLGKTEVFCAMIDRLLRHPRHASSRFLVLADRDHLVDGPYHRFQKRFPAHASRAGMVKAERDETNAQVIFASVQTLVVPGRLDHVLAHGAISFVVTDEAHRAVTAQHETILDTLRAAYPPLRHVGCTATPLRADGLAMGRAFDVVPIKHEIDWGIREKYLVPVKWLGIKTGVSIKGLRASSGDFSQKQLASLLDTDNFVDLVVASHKKYAAGRQGIVFVPSVALAYRMAEEFTAAGIPAAAADGTTPKPARAALMRQFQEGTLKMLACYPGLWGEGLDLPELSVVHMACPTKSVGRYLQCVGRGLRPAAWVQKEDCLVLDYAPVENRKIVTMGDVLLGEMERRVLQDQEEKDDEILGGFVFDGQFKGLEGDPLALVAIQLHYLDKQPIAGTQYDGWIFLALGADAAGRDRVLAVSPPDETHGDDLRALHLVTQEKHARSAVVTTLASGARGEMLAEAESYAATHANTTLAAKAAAWRGRPISKPQRNYMYALARKSEIEKWAGKPVKEFTQGDAANAIALFKAVRALQEYGRW